MTGTTQKLINNLGNILALGGGLTLATAIGFSNPTDANRNRQDLNALAAANIMMVTGMGLLAYNNKLGNKIDDPSPK